MTYLAGCPEVTQFAFDQELGRDVSGWLDLSCLLALLVKFLHPLLHGQHLLATQPIVSNTTNSQLATTHSQQPTRLRQHLLATTCSQQLKTQTETASVSNTTTSQSTTQPTLNWQHNEHSVGNTTNTQLATTNTLSTMQPTRSNTPHSRLATHPAAGKHNPQPPPPHTELATHPTAGNPTSSQQHSRQHKKQTETASFKQHTPHSVSNTRNKLRQYLSVTPSTFSWQHDPQPATQENISNIFTCVCVFLSFSCRSMSRR